MKKALLLGLIIFCILSAGCIDWGGGGETEKDTPTVHATSWFSDGEYHVKVTQISHDTTVNAVMYFIQKSNDDAVEQGDVADIYSKDVDGVFFQDTDADGELSENDLFIIKDTNNGGPGESDRKLVLKYTVTGKTMLKIPLEE